ncbi:MAG: PD-(D/E)XK motif protein [Alphaproteobacteria bacterium]
MKMKSTECMHRWSKDHPLPVHVTEGHLSAFMLISPSRPPAVKQSKAVSVSIEEYSEGQWRLEFRLNDPRYYLMFKAFYEDVFESTWNVKLEDAAAKFIEIYKKWKRAFSTDGLPLTKEEVQGLIGEMCVIDEILLKKYDPKTVLDGWMLSQKGKQDFVFSDTWYEVKSTHVGSNTVTITSAEQLDCTTDGYLSVVKLKNTSVNDEKKVNLSIITNRLLKTFDDYNCGEEFLMKLAELGLPSDKYDDQVYEIIELEQYTVKDGFPCLKRSTLSPAIGLVQYELYLEQLRIYKV